MSAINNHVGLLIALLAILLLRPRRVKPETAAYGSQRMCPACGLITSRLEACCLECGKSLTAVSVTQIVGR
jgi:predicted amidophosphoribosyltransferase